MKRKILVLVLVLVCCPSLYQTCSAQEDDFSISGYAGYFNTSSSVFIDSDADFETDMAFGGALTYHFSRAFSAELSITRSKSVMNLSFDDKKENFGEVEQIPILLTGRFQFPIRKSSSHIYMGLGVGYFINDFEHIKREAPVEFFGVNLHHAEIHNSFSFHANVGAEMRLGTHFATYLDLKAIFNQPQFDVVYADLTTTKKDLGMNVSLFVWGAKYYF